MYICGERERETDRQTDRQTDSGEDRGREEIQHSLLISIHSTYPLPGKV